MSNNSSSSSSASIGCECLPIISFIAIWFLLFGLTWNGSHYSLSCSADRGVEISSAEVD